jgi:hypothetical protein
MSTSLAEYLGSLAREIRSIARGCFDLQTVEQLRFLAEKLERRASEDLLVSDARNNATNDDTK